MAVALPLYYFFDRPLYAINNPKFGIKNEGFSTIEEMAAAYIKIMTNIQPNGPYIIGGWSFGGIVAIEMAKQLVKLGEAPQKIILIDTYNFAKSTENRDDSIIFDQFKRDLENENVSIETSEGALLLQEMFNNYKLLLQYTPPEVPLNIDLIKATIVSKDAEKRDVDDIFNGWLNLFPQNLTVHSVAASHADVLKKDHIDDLARSLNRILANIDIETPVNIIDSIELTLNAAAINQDKYIIDIIKNKYI